MAKKEAIGKLLKINTHYLKLAQLDYSNALQEVYSQIKKVEALKQEIDSLSNELVQKQKSGTIKSDKLKELSEFLQIGYQNLAREEISLKEKEELAEILRKKMEEANKEKEISERLYKGMIAREREERETKERKAIDESATSRFFYRK